MRRAAFSLTGYGFDAELRNQVYDLVAATAEPIPRCSALPGLKLAQTCQQIRAEYLPTCRKAEVSINWNDVSRYLEIMDIGMSAGAIGRQQEPSTMNIIINGDDPVMDIRKEAGDLLHEEVGIEGVPSRLKRAKNELV